MSVTAITLVVFVFLDPSVGRNIKASVEGLLNAEEIYQQLELIEHLMGKLVNGSKCARFKEKPMVEDGDETGSGKEKLCYRNGWRMGSGYSSLYSFSYIFIS